MSNIITESLLIASHALIKMLTNINYCLVQ